MRVNGRKPILSNIENTWVICDPYMFHIFMGSSIIFQSYVAMYCQACTSEAGNRERARRGAGDARVVCVFCAPSVRVVCVCVCVCVIVCV